jgi:TolB-like protein/tetratricopeptide (TPR) repeat protein
MRTLFTELRRRRVFRVAGIYGIVAWVIAEVADVVFPALQLPDWTVTFVVALLILGFPIAMFFAWVFDIGPQGIERTAPLEERKTGMPALERAIYFVLLVAAMGGLAYLLYPRIDGGPEGAPGNSIAVLPFANLSQDKGDDYFSDGMSEELLNLLARVPGLRVAARTSSFAFKDKEVDVREVARQLGVDTVLEGSVRQAGNRVRITAQLIDAKTGYHLWSDTYDRELEDIFAVQDEISSEILNALKVKLGTDQTGQTPVARAAPPTGDVEAYQLYLRGRHQWKLRGKAPLERSIELFEQSLVRDPDFARAYAGLAAAYVVMPGYAGEDRGPWYEKATTAAQQALARDPTLAEAHSVLALIAYTETRWTDAEAGFFFATSLDANDPTTRHWYSMLLRDTGRLQLALEEARRALALDPTSPALNVNLAQSYMALGYDDQALHYRQAADELGSQSSEGPDIVRMMAAIRTGDPASLRTTLEAKSAEEPLPPELVDAVVTVAADRSRWPELERVLATEAIAEADESDWFAIYALLDRPEKALEIALESPDEIDFGILWMPEAAVLRRLPGFVTLAERAELLDYWKQYGWPDDCRPVGDTFQCGFSAIAAAR